MKDLFTSLHLHSYLNHIRNKHNVRYNQFKNVAIFFFWCHKIYWWFNHFLLLICSIVFSVWTQIFQKKWVRENCRVKEMLNRLDNSNMTFRLLLKIHFLNMKIILKIFQLYLVSQLRYNYLVTVFSMWKKVMFAYSYYYW